VNLPVLPPPLLRSQLPGWPERSGERTRGRPAGGRASDAAIVTLHVRGGLIVAAVGLCLRISGSLGALGSTQRLRKLTNNKILFSTATPRRRLGLRLGVSAASATRGVPPPAAPLAHWHSLAGRAAGPRAGESGDSADSRRHSRPGPASRLAGGLGGGVARLAATGSGSGSRCQPATTATGSAAVPVAHWHCHCSGSGPHCGLRSDSAARRSPPTRSATATATGTACHSQTDSVPLPQCHWRRRPPTHQPNSGQWQPESPPPPPADHDSTPLTQTLISVTLTVRRATASGSATGRVPQGPSGPSATSGSGKVQLGARMLQRHK